MVHIRHNVIIDCEPAKVFNGIATKTGIQGWWTVDTIIEPVVGRIAEILFKDKVTLPRCGDLCLGFDGIFKNLSRV